MARIKLAAYPEVLAGASRLVLRGAGINGLSNPELETGPRPHFSPHFSTFA